MGTFWDEVKGRAGLVKRKTSTELLEYRTADLRMKSKNHGIRFLAVDSHSELVLGLTATGLSKSAYVASSSNFNVPTPVKDEKVCFGAYHLVRNITEI